MQENERERRGKQREVERERENRADHSDERKNDGGGRVVRK